MFNLQGGKTYVGLTRWNAVGRKTEDIKGNRPLNTISEMRQHQRPKAKYTRKQTAHRPMWVIETTDGQRSLERQFEA